MNSIALEITIKSACVLKRVNFLDRRRIYIVVSLIGSNSFSKQRTNVDLRNGSKPCWGFKMKFEVEESKMHANSCMLVFQVRCSKPLGDKDIGYLYVPVRELFQGVRGQRDVAYTVTTSSGKPKGILYFKYEFGQNIMVKRSVDKDIIRVLPPPSAPPLQGFSPATTCLFPSAPPYNEEN